MSRSEVPIQGMSQVLLLLHARHRRVYKPTNSMLWCFRGGGDRCVEEEAKLVHSHEVPGIYTFIYKGQESK